MAGAAFFTAAITLNFIGAAGQPFAPQTVSAAAASSDQAQALKTLNSFYKPALKGQFPGAVADLTVGVSTRQDVQEKIGKPDSPGKDSDAFDVYNAEMGHPGYTVSYKKDRIREIRYFGTNVERQTNIGGITLQMLVHNWGKPNASKTIKNGKLIQKKIVYNRGDYALSFIFNDNAHLDHINLTVK
ncbi:YjgB family protein [Paenibacillus oralis]|uniref:YjgB family protein n=1 Tax=Paenibacillus oralis TaxID=2490856 RepID=UPI001FE979DF|nr:YjgB family protein [Paenibacillus oralis]